MGLYINPEGMTKEDWLDDNNINKSMTPFSKELIGEDNFAVCLVSNGAFTAAAVAFNEREYNDFKEPDGRPKIWFIVKKSAIKKVCPDYDFYV